MAHKYVMDPNPWTGPSGDTTHGMNKQQLKNTHGLDLRGVIPIKASRGGGPTKWDSEYWDFAVKDAKEKKQQAEKEAAAALVQQVGASSSSRTYAKAHACRCSYALW